MKSTTNKKTQEKVYPYLGVDDYTGRIIFFTGPGAGVQVNTAKRGERALGYYAPNWAEQSFRLFQGEVILSND